VAIDPDSEVICAAEVGAANTGDAAMAAALLADLPGAPGGPESPAAEAVPADQAASATTDQTPADQAPVVYGDAAHGTGGLLADLEQGGITAMTKVAAPTAPAGHCTKQQFRIDLDQGRVTCPARLKVPIIPARQGGGVAGFGRACQVCPLQGSCTSSPAGRTITIHPHEPRLQAARQRQRDPAWRADYRAHRPTVEPKLAHLLRRRHGGRRARVRGRVRVAQDWRLLAAAVNLARFAVLGVHSRPGGWAVVSA
jgi:DDE family transposase